MSVLMPIEPFLSDQHQLLALCIWREARNQPDAAMLGVAWTIKNRCSMAPREGFKADIAGNVLKPWAFSSFMEGDPNSTKYPEPGPVWDRCLAAARSAEADPTGSAVFYYSPPLMQPPSAWGSVEHSADIGELHFCRIV